MGFPPEMINKCYNSSNKHISGCAVCVDWSAREGEAYVCACLDGGGREEGP